MKKSSTFRDARHKLWSKMVRSKCGGKCVICGSVKRLQAHHWFADFDHCRRLRYVAANGVALCWHCHHIMAHECGCFQIHLAILQAAQRAYGFDVAERLARKLKGVESADQD